MSDYQILHNPRCSKSRQALALLQENGIEPEIVEYLKTPLSKQELELVCRKLGTQAETIVRKKEEQFKALDLAGQELSHDQWLEILSQHPKLIERPIVIKGDIARVGRPPEKVLELISV